MATKQPSACAKKAKGDGMKKMKELGRRIGKAAIRQAATIWNSLIDSIQTFVNAQLEILRPLAEIDDLILNTMILPPLDATEQIVGTLVDTIKVPIDQLGVFGGPCSDVRATAEAISRSLDKPGRVLDKLREYANRIHEFSLGRFLDQLQGLLDMLDTLKVSEEDIAAMELEVG